MAASPRKRRTTKGHVFSHFEYFNLFLTHIYMGQKRSTYIIGADTINRAAPVRPRAIKMM